MDDTGTIKTNIGDDEPTALGGATTEVSSHRGPSSFLPVFSSPPALPTFRRILYPGALAMIVLFTIAIAFSLKRSADQYTDRADTIVGGMSQILTDDLVGVLDRIDLTLLNIGDKLSEQAITGFGADPNFPDLLDHLASRLPEIAGLRVYDAKGRLVHANGAFAPSGASIEDQEFFQSFAHSMAAGMTISKPVLDEKTHAPTLFMARAIRGADGGFKGVVLAEMRARNLLHLFTKIDLGPHGVVALWHRGATLTLVARQPTPPALPGQDPATTILSGYPSTALQQGIEANLRQAGYHAASRLDGVQRTIFWRQAGNTPLYMVVGLAEDDVMAPWRREVAVMGASLAIFIALSLGSAKLIDREWHTRGKLTESLFTALNETEAARAVIARSHDDLKHLIAQAPHAICMLDGNLDCVAVSHHWVAEFLQLPTDPSRLAGPAKRDQWVGILQSALDGVTYRNDEDLWEFADGSRHWVRWVVCPWTDGRGAVGGVIVSAEDVSVKRKAEEKLRQAAVVFNSTQDGIVITETDGTMIAVNPSVTTITGYTEQELLGNTLRLVKSGRHDAHFYRSIFDCVAKDGYWQGEIWNRRKNGDIYPQWLTISKVVDDTGQLVNYVGTFSDITRIKQSEAMLEHLAHHDPLTGLPNRLLLQSRLEHAIGRSRRSGGSGAVFFIDLDRFKNVNDSLGHPAGDELLQLVSERFRSRLRACDTLARLGGDEFVVLLEDLTAPENAGVVAQTLLDSVAEPFHLSAGHDIYINASIGISTFPHDGEQADRIIRNADTAMYQAKSNGRGTYRFYTLALTQAADARVEMETNLRRAMERKELVVFYQPLVSLETGRMSGFEALVRWKQGLRLIPPAEFIGLAEETGLIGALGGWVLETACRQMAQWRKDRLDIDTIAVNVSPRQFRDPAFVTDVRAVLTRFGLPGSCLELELTESILIEAGAETQAKLAELRDMKIRMTIDDFGTGYSSLSYLKRFPVDKLKVDQSFIRGIPGDLADEQITSAIIAMAKSLDLEVVAEGIESDEQFNFLNALGCHTGQGFLFSQAVPAGVATQLIRMLHHGQRPEDGDALVFPQLWG